MSVKAVVLVGVFTGLLAIVQGWPNFYDPAFERYDRLARRSGSCIFGGGECYKSAECCEGFVCATYDDYFDENPVKPGVCLKEKDLQKCVSSLNCPSDSRCMMLSPGDRYCIRSQRSMAQTQPKGHGRGSYNLIKGGLGADCGDDSDCQEFTEDGADKLCCQKISRGRQGTKKMCERIRSVSKCISK